MSGVPRRVWWVLAGAVLLVVAAVFVDVRRSREDPPRTDVEAVMQVHRRFVEAVEDGDHDRLWEMLSPSLRRELEGYLGDARRRPAQAPDFDEAEIRDMGLREFLETGLARYARSHPDLRAAELDLLASLRIREVELDGDGACVWMDEAEWFRLVPEPNWYPLSPEVGFYYERAEAGWRFAGLITPAWPSHALDSKLEIFLPKRDRGALRDRVRIVITVGEQGLSEEGRDLLAARMREWAKRDFEPCVLIDVAPGADFQSAVRAADACVEAGYEEIWFAVPTAAGPPPGVRVNGVPVSEPFAEGEVDRSVADRVPVAGLPFEPTLELRLACVNPASPEGVPWILELTYVNRGGRAFRPAGTRLHLDTCDPAGVATLPAGQIHDPRKEAAARRAAGDTVILAGPCPATGWLVLDGRGAFGAEGPEVAPGARHSWIGLVPRRPGGWKIRAEMLLAGEVRARSDTLRLGDPATAIWTPMGVYRSVVEPPGAAAETEPVRVRANALLAALREGSLEHLEGRARTDPDRTVRLLAALCARLLDEDTGRLLLRQLAQSDDPALREAAARIPRGRAR